MTSLEEKIQQWRDTSFEIYPDPDQSDDRLVWIAFRAAIHGAAQTVTVPLTDEQIREIYMKYGTGRFDGFTAAVHAIEAAHGIGEEE